MGKKCDRPALAQEAKAIVALAFRNGPIESVHAGKPCPRCNGKPGYSRITDSEMKTLMKNAVDQVYALLCLKVTDPRRYAETIGKLSVRHLTDRTENLV